MVYERYVVKKGKRYGPYLYKSIRDESGRVKNVYVGRGAEKPEPAPPKKTDLSIPLPRTSEIPELMPEKAEIPEKLEHHPISEPIEIEEKEIEEKPAEETTKETEPYDYSSDEDIPEKNDEMVHEQLPEAHRGLKKDVFLKMPAPAGYEDIPAEPGEDKKEGIFSRFRSVFAKKKKSRIESLETELKRLEKRLEEKRKKQN